MQHSIDEQLYTGQLRIEIDTMSHTNVRQVQDSQETLHEKPRNHIASGSSSLVAYAATICIRNRTAYPITHHLAISSFAASMEARDEVLQSSGSE